MISSPQKEVLEKARLLIRQKEWEEAKNCLLSIVEQGGTPESFTLLGHVYYDLGQFDYAVAAFKKALSLDAGFTEAALSLSILYNDLGRYEEGKFHFNRVKHQIEKVSDDPFIQEKFARKHEELGDLYLHYGYFDEALRQFEQGLKLKVDLIDLQIKIAKTYERIGSSDKALALLKKIKTEHPHYVPALTALGLHYYAQGSLIQAVSEWENVLQVDPHNKDASMYLQMAQQASTTRL